MRDIDEFLIQVRDWAEQEERVVAVALVGSHARGEATEASDIDLVILSDSPQHFLDASIWIETWAEPMHVELEDWGKVQSLRVRYADGREIEFGIAGLDWLAEPVDEGTAQVINDGLEIVFERDAFISRILQKPGLQERPNRKDT